ncbi:MAG: hypothetical protein RRZ73_03400, partial [Oscillospiraceae bacterium]
MNISGLKLSNIPIRTPKASGGNNNAIKQLEKQLKQLRSDLIKMETQRQEAVSNGTDTKNIDNNIAMQQQSIQAMEQQIQELRRQDQQQSAQTVETVEKTNEINELEAVTKTEVKTVERRRFDEYVKDDNFEAKEDSNIYRAK